MVSLINGIAWASLLLASAGFTFVAVRVERRQEFPGKWSFVSTCLLIAVMIFCYTIFQTLSLPPGPPTNPGFVEAIGFLLFIAIILSGLMAPLIWIRFGLTFTGQSVPTDRRTMLRLGLPIMVALLAVIVFIAFPLLSFAFGQQVLPDRHFGLVTDGVLYVLTFTTFYLGALLVVGASLIAWTSYTYRHLSTRGGALLGIGPLLPWAALIIPGITGLIDTSIVLTYHLVVGGGIGIGAVWTAVFSYTQFENVPAAGTVGREVTVETMNDPVIVVDEDRQIIDLNPAAERAFDAAKAIGRPLDTVYDDVISITDIFADSQTGVEVPTEDRIFETSTSELRDQHNRLLGHSIVFHDITERKRRQQRIQVLNRVLRHNLRNDLNAVNGYAELLEDEASNTKEYAIRIQEMASELISIGEKAREIEEVVATERETRTEPLAEIIDQAVHEVRSHFGGCRIQTELPTENPEVNSLILTSLLKELLENACRHNDSEDPEVDIEAHIDSTAEYPVQISVADNGPGIPDHELAPLQEGAESALEHGSGLGLWLVEWGVTKLNGQIEFGPNQPRGTIVSLGVNPVN